VLHVVGAYRSELVVERIAPLTRDCDAIFFTDHTHAKIGRDMRWLERGGG
jgi:hypothetical protein